MSTILENRSFTPSAREVPPATPAVEAPLGFMGKATPQLRATVEKYQLLLPTAEFEKLIATIRSAFGKYQARLLQFQPGVERGRALHEMMDREMGAVAMLPVTCGKGCSGCCHYEVEITSDDAAVLNAVVQAGREIDHEKLSVQAARERRSPEWRRFGSKDNRCVFLDASGACGIYEDRPAVCRKHMVTTPAADCTTEGAAVAPVQVLLADILLSAELSIAGTEFGSLPKLLQKSLHASAARDEKGERAHAKPAAQANTNLRPAGRAAG